jgi:hypothetical protein
MPTTLRYPLQPARPFFQPAKLAGNRDAQIGSGAALLIAWTVIMMIFAAAVPGQEATATDPFQLLATF